MRRLNCGKALLVGACMLAGTAAWAQQARNNERKAPVSTDLAVTYAPERAQSSTGSFWLDGGGVDVAVNLLKGIGVVVSFSGSHASLPNGVDVNKITILGGERYTRQLRMWHADTPRERSAQFFGEWLWGDVHAFNSVFPAIGGVKSGADAFAMQAGGGINLPTYKRFAVRLVQVDYIKTALPNNDVSHAQNGLRLAFGVTYHIGGK